MKAIKLFIAFAIAAPVFLTSCDSKEKIKQELKEEMAKEEAQKRLEEENAALKAQLGQTQQQAAVAQAVAQAAAQQVAEANVQRVRIKNANGAGAILRISPSMSNSARWSGNGAPHFYTGYVFECIGSVGAFYKVCFDGDEYYLAKKVASPCSNSAAPGGPMSFSAAY